MCTRLFTLAVLPAGARREEINRHRRRPWISALKGRRRSHVESAGGGAEKYGGCLTGGVNSGQVSGARRLLIFIMENDGGRAVGW